MNSTVALTLSAVSVRDDKGPMAFEDADILLRKMLQESTIIQQAGIIANQSRDFNTDDKHPGALVRHMPLPTLPSAERLHQYNVKVIDKFEIYRILLGWQQRLKIAEYLKSTGWTATYVECEVALGKFNYQWYENIKRSRSLPAVPKIKNARIPLAKSALQFCWRADLRGQRITLPKLALWDRIVDLHFEIPAALLRLHPNTVKITRPTIFLKNDTVTFDFTFEEPLVKENVTNRSVLAVDIGQVKIFSAVRVYDDHRVSEEFVPSIFTDRQTDRIKIHSTEIKRASKKNKSRELLGNPKESAITHEKLLRAKRSRTWEGAEWSAAADLKAHLKPGEELIVEKLNFNTGGSQFRSAVLAKVEHSLNRSGKNMRRVKAAYTSQTCPDCQTRVEPEKRILNCPNCDWSEDRDVSAAIVIGQRGLKLKKPRVVRDKNKPTPKRPRPSVRNRVKVIIKKVVRSAYTGADSAEATNSVTVATSVNGAPSALFSHSVNPAT